MGVAGHLITIEGVDGAGKTTLALGLARALASRGVAALVLREPGGVPAAERIRALLADPALEIGPRAEALLYAAARAQLIEQSLAGALASGACVLLDRFVDSSLAYQGAGRGLGIEAVRELNAFAIGGLEPQLTLLLDLEPALALARAHARVNAPDRVEREDLAFFTRIRAAYLALAAAERRRIRVLDAARPPQAVLEAALNALDATLRA